MKILYLISLLIVNLPVFSQGKENTIICITNNCNDPKQVYYIDDLFFGHPIFLEKRQSLEIKISQPLYFFCTDKSQHFIKAFPGDSISIIEQEKKMFFKSSKQNGLNSFYNKVFNEIGPLRLLTLNNFGSAIPTLAARDSFYSALYSQRIDFLNNQKPPLNIEEYREAFSLIKSAFILEKIKAPTSLFSLDSIKSFYRDSVSSLDLQLKSIQDYPLNPITREAALRIVEYKIYLNSKCVDLFSCITESYSQNLKNYLIAHKLKEQLDSGYRSKLVDSLFSKYIPLISDDDLVKMLMISYNSEKKKILFLEKKVELLNFANEFTSINKIIKNNLGKIIFIDLWASWCIPCISEFSYTERLIKKYPKIKFVFISLDKNWNEWDNAKLKYSILNAKNSFLLINNFQSKFAKSIKLSEIPRYIIVDKNGKIINLDAPRPSDSHLLKIFDLLIF